MTTKNGRPAAMAKQRPVSLGQGAWGSTVRVLAGKTVFFMGPLHGFPCCQQGAALPTAGASVPRSLKCSLYQQSEPHPDGSFSVNPHRFLAFQVYMSVTLSSPLPMFLQISPRLHDSFDHLILPRPSRRKRTHPQTRIMSPEHT